MSLRRLLLWLSPFFLLLLLVVASISSVLAAVPNDKATPAYAEEQTILQSEQGQPEPGLGDAASGRQHLDRHYIKPPGLMPEQNVILQRGGNTWRTWRNGPLSTIAGTLLLLVPLAILALYRVFGPQRIEGGETGRDIQRFTRLDRWTHWATAITFIGMAITGLIILFGKKLLLPWMGHDVFSWFAIISKYAHNILGPLFILCSLAMFFTFVRRNRFERADWQWLKAGGGLVSHAHVPAPYFNLGEKMWFWIGVTLLGGLMALSGLMLNFPYFAGNTPGPGFTRYLLQWANVLHLLGAAAYIAFAMGHIYLGTLGSPGAYRGMRHGAVDEAWVRTHHELWWRQIIARDRDRGATGRR